MSNLDLEFDKAVEEFHTKLKQAAELLVEASKLSAKHTISADSEEIENLQNIVNEFDIKEWDESDADSWMSSSINC